MRMHTAERYSTNKKDKDRWLQLVHFWCFFRDK